MMAFVYQIIDCKRIEQPITDTSFLHIICIFDIVVIATFPVTIDIYIKDLFDGNAPVMKGS